MNHRTDLSVRAILLLYATQLTRTFSNPLEIPTSTNTPTTRALPRAGEKDPVLTSLSRWMNGNHYALRPLSLASSHLQAHVGAWTFVSSCLPLERGPPLNLHPCLPSGYVVSGFRSSIVLVSHGRVTLNIVRSMATAKKVQIARSLHGTDRNGYVNSGHQCPYSVKGLLPKVR